MKKVFAAIFLTWIMFVMVTASEGSPFDDQKVDPVGNPIGTWKMSGYQNMFPKALWEADLLLKADGTMTWTETKGANVGASRNGQWTLSENKLNFQYQAPEVGTVTWNGTVDSARRNASGTYNAGANNAYGGVWSARKI